MKKRILAVVLLFILTIYCANPTYSDNEGKAPEQITAMPNLKTILAGGFKAVAENDQITLCFKEETGEIAVLEKASNDVWFSNPQDWKEDPLAKGINKTNLRAQFLCEYITGTETRFQKNNFISSINKGGMKVNYVKDGLDITYDFPEDGLTIPVQYRITADGFEMSVDTSLIKEASDIDLISITFMPNLAAGGRTDKGYVLVPDGCGAVIDFNNGNTEADEYSAPVYGYNLALNLLAKETKEEPVRLPVYGITKNDGCMLAIITEGAARSNLLAYVSGKKASYNGAATKFTLRSIDKTILMEGDYNEKESTLLSKTDKKPGRLGVQYSFMRTGSSSLGTLADRYRRYLENEKKLQKRDAAKMPAMYVNLVGGMRRIKPFLGIPLYGVEVFSTFKDCSMIYDQLKTHGISNIKLSLSGWQKGGKYNKVEVSSKPESLLGGKSDFEALLQKLGDDFYPSSDIISMYKSGNGYSTLFNAARSVTGGPSLQYDYRLGTGNRNRWEAPYKLLNPLLVPQALDKLTGGIKKLGAKSIALERIGSEIYSYFGKNTTNADAVSKEWELVLNKADGQFDNLMLDGGNAYAATHVDHLKNIPVYSSRFGIADREVPFYQMVFHSYVSYASEAVNACANTEDMILRLVETATNPSFDFVGRNVETLKETKLNYMTAADYKVWLEDAKRIWQQLEPVLTKVADRRMTDYRELEPNVFATYYEGNIATIVNYNEKPVKVSKQEMKAKSFILVEGMN